MAIDARKHACKPHPYQDKMYKGRRVFTKTANDKLRCTVCGKEQ